MAALNLQQNVGPGDRIFRGAVGTALILNGLNPRMNPIARMLGMISGGMLIASGASGSCMLYSKLGISSDPGVGNSLFTRVRAFLPGQGVKPEKTGQAIPKSIQPRPEKATIADTLAVGR